MIEQYDIYWKDEYIGRLLVNTTTGMHSYLPNSEGVTKVKDEAALLTEMVNGTDGFVSPIPFFQNRLYNMKRNHLDTLRYHTDYFMIKRCP